MASLPLHPMVAFARKQQRRLVKFYVLFGALFTALGYLAEVTTLIIVLLLAFGAAFGGVYWSWGRTIASASLVQINNTAYQHLAKGEHAEAEELLKSIDNPPPYLRCAIEGQLALLAMARGDLASVKVHANNTLAQPVRFMSRSHQSMQRASAYSLLALCAAFDKNQTDVESNVLAACKIKSAMPETIARTAVAECVLAWQQGDRETLATLLQAKARAIRFASPRERVLVRTMHRYMAIDGSSVYREPAERDEDDAVGLAWINAIAPGAATYAPVTSFKSRATMRAALETLHRAALPAPERIRGMSNVQKAALGMLVVAIAPTPFLFILQVAVPDGTRGSVAGSAIADVALVVPAMLLIGFVAVLCLLGSRQIRMLAALPRAIRMRIENESSQAIAALRPLSESQVVAVYPPASLHLADELEMQGAWVDAVETTTKAIYRVAKQELARNTFADIVLPELIRKRSFLSAVGNHLDDALADLALLRRDFPTYPYLPIAEFETDLVTLIRRGDLDQAKALVMARTLDLGIRPNVQLLCDWVLAKTGELSRRDVRLLQAETDREPGALQWLNVVAPGLATAS